MFVSTWVRFVAFCVFVSFLSIPVRAQLDADGPDVALATPAEKSGATTGDLIQQNQATQIALAKERATRLARVRRTDERTRVAWELHGLLTEITSPAAREQILMTALGDASRANRPALLSLLADAPSDGTLQVLRKTLNSGDRLERTAAVHALLKWPNDKAASDFLALIRLSPDPRIQAGALAAWLRVHPTGGSESCRTIVGAIGPVPSGRKVIAAIQPTPQSAVRMARFLQNLVKSRDYRSVAGPALVRVGAAIVKTDEEVACDVLETAVKESGSRRVSSEAQDILNRLDRYQDHIRQWAAVGPFRLDGADAQAVHSAPFVPERNPVPWKSLSRGIGDWEIDLKQTFGDQDHACVYVKTVVYSATAQRARLEIGSDDGMRAWLNARPVYRDWKPGNCQPQQVIVPIQLQKGRTEIVLKVVNRTGDWGFCCRVRRLDGAALPDVKLASSINQRIDIK